MLMTLEKSPIMLALHLMLLLSYCTQNYAGIIGSSLNTAHGSDAGFIEP